MPAGCLFYYITDRTAFADDEPTRCRRLLEKIAEAARAGIDYIQLREKDLSTRELESLAREAAGVIREVKIGNREPRTALLINSRTDVALTVEADGVHLRSNDVSPREVSRIWSCGAGTHARELPPRSPVVGISCHSPAETAQAATDGATFAVFASVFEKKDSPTTQPAGLVQLREACKANIPVFALGGVTLANTRSCLEAGAAGIAAIRLFQENDIAEVIKALRSTQ
jgi:thiamine-phosphate pyrophosphorylase